MTTHTAAQGLSLPIPRTALRPETAARIPAPAAPRASWMERLAAWAERQPVHHRMGSYQRVR